MKILDFGLARGGGAESGLTQEGAIVGTPGYMSPEQAQGRGVDHRCDLFSLGCVLYRIATGEPPFRGTDTISTLLAISTQTPPAPSRVNAALPPSLSDLIMELLAKDPAHRPPSSQAVAETLERIAQTPAPRLAVAIPTTRSRWPVPLGVATCLLLTSLAIMWAGGSLRLSTRDGTIVLEDLPANAEVRVDGATAKVNYGPGGKWIEVQVAPGERMLLIKAAGFKAKTQDVTLTTGERKPIRIRLEPLATDSKEVTTARTTADAGSSGRPAEAPPPAIAPFDSFSAKKHQDAWATYLNIPVEFTDSIGMTLRLIPPGEFTMGSTAAEIDAARPRLHTAFDPARPERVLTEGPQRRVVITKPFYMGVHEVTQRQYERVNGTNPSWWSVTGGGSDRLTGRDRSDSPVENVSWAHAVSWCNLLSKTEQLKAAYQTIAGSTTAIADAGYRLPTEAEWEYACRGGTSTLFWSGDDEASLTWAAWYGANNSPDLPKAVGTRAANPFGLYDVHGNVWEWVHDGWDPVFYQRLVGSSAWDPRSEMAIDGRRVIRGGDYFMPAAECRSSCRDGYHANTVYDDLGFRVALSLEAVRKLKEERLLNMVKPGDSFKDPASKPESTVTEAAPSKNNPADREPRVLYSDDFTYRKSELTQSLREPDEKNQPIGSGFGEGVYFMQERTSGNWGINVRGDLIDFSCESVGRVVRDKPAARGSWGILLLSRARGLQIMINSEGQLLIQPSFWTANAYPNDPRIGPIVHPAIRSGNEFNTLRLNVRRRRLEVLVNDVAVCPPVLLDWDLTPARVEFGLWVDAPKIRAEFDRIELKALPPDTTVPVKMPSAHGSKGALLGSTSGLTG